MAKGYNILLGKVIKPTVLYKFGKFETISDFIKNSTYASVTKNADSMKWTVGEDPSHDNQNTSRFISDRAITLSKFSVILLEVQDISGSNGYYTVFTTSGVSSDYKLSIGTKRWLAFFLVNGLDNRQLEFSISNSVNGRSSYSITQIVAYELEKIIGGG